MNTEVTIGGQPFLIESRLLVNEETDEVEDLCYEVFFGSKIGPRVWEAQLPWGTTPEGMMDVMTFDGGLRECVAFLHRLREIGPRLIEEELARQKEVKAGWAARFLAERPV